MLLTICQTYSTTDHKTLVHHVDWTPSDSADQMKDVRSQKLHDSEADNGQSLVCGCLRPDSQWSQRTSCKKQTWHR